MTSDASPGAGPTTLRHSMEGDPAGPALVLSNSLGTTTALWKAQRQRLGRGRRLLLYDHRGHGRSPVPPPPYEIADLARDALALLDELGLERVSWCGVSLGGMIGIWLAAYAPQRIERLVVCCSSAHMPPTAKWERRARRVRAAGSVEAVADEVVDGWLTPGFAERNPHLRAALRRMLVATSAEGYAACCEAIGRMDLRPALAAVRAPTLVIAADHDRAAPPAEHGARIAAGVRGARLELVSHAAHLANVEQPERVSALILEHLDG